MALGLCSTKENTARKSGGKNIYIYKLFFYYYYNFFLFIYIFTPKFSRAEHMSVWEGWREMEWNTALILFMCVGCVCMYTHCYYSSLSQFSMKWTFVILVLCFFILFYYFYCILFFNKKNNIISFLRHLWSAWWSMRNKTNMRNHLFLFQI